MNERFVRLLFGRLVEQPQGTGVLGEDGDGGKRWWARGLPFLGDGLAREGEASARKEIACETGKRGKVRDIAMKHVRG